ILKICGIYVQKPIVMWDGRGDKRPPPGPAIDLPGHCPARPGLGCQDGPAMKLARMAARLEA
ncbi:MAG: hypothetical protein PVG33_13900, partial [Chloroflexota bacterium]